MAAVLTSPQHAPGWVDQDPAGPDAPLLRDWTEIQERMMVPLYEAVYERLSVGAGTRLLAVGCGAGLALLLAAVRGAAVTGTDPDERRLALARRRLLPDPHGAGPAGWPAPRPAAPGARLLRGGPEAAGPPGGPAYTVVTAFGPVGPEALDAAARLAERGSPVVLTGWGPPDRCATARVLGAGPRSAPAGQDAADTVAAADGAGGAAPEEDPLAELARDAGLRPAAVGRVACPFGYPDLDSAVRGLLAAGRFEPGRPAGAGRPAPELTEALRAFQRPDGSVRMDNDLRYLIARV